MKVAGTVFVFSLALKQVESNMTKSAIAASLTLCPTNSSTGVLPLVFEMLQCFICALGTNPQMTRVDGESTFEMHASPCELFFQVDN